MKGNIVFVVLKFFKLGMFCEDEFLYFCYWCGYSFWYLSMFWCDIFFIFEIVLLFICWGYSVFVVMVVEIILIN